MTKIIWGPEDGLIQKGTYWTQTTQDAPQMAPTQDICLFYDSKLGVLVYKIGEHEYILQGGIPQFQLSWHHNEIELNITYRGHERLSEEKIKEVKDLIKVLEVAREIDK